MNKTVKEWQKKLDALDQRERILVMVTGLAVVVMLLQAILIDPLLIERKRLDSKLRDVSQQLQLQKNAQEALSKQLAAGINRNKQKRRDQLQAEVDALNERIETSVDAMIPQRLMPEVLESILGKNGELKLLSLENKPVVPVIEETDLMEGESGQGLYKHSFVLHLSGSYMGAIRYFEQLSQLPWRFHWDDLRYQVESYPNAIITLEVHTVSMSKEWIGV